MDDIPPLPSIDGNSFANIGRLIAFRDGQVDGYNSAADQMHAYAVAYAAAEVAKEREWCAALCDRFAARDMHPAECAAAIRKGG
jgi:hypothetical protein